ncbi:FAD-dependent oxidoreductase [Niabella ginsenosidivorans]|uniref:FAD-dependent oxidoreductase n=1 Tax=Niabella ginsenosidivorans TaxID=1176587 RepID=A0A1A9HY72_9BACT|nr:FAD-dependent oxidoreductase [Niabella ginsenosidivorans]ANH80337.1 FAD-dependent oxidoreductase [Niabella ginsenosidivorans]
MAFSKQQLIIVGLGISGTFLSWFCHQAGIDFMVIDEERPNVPSRVAAGIINPVTGRRVVKVWLDDQVLPFAEKAYQSIGDFLGINAITKTSVIDFFPNPFMKEPFLKKLSRKEAYIRLLEDDSQFAPYFNYEFGTGVIEPAYIVNMTALLPAWRNFLKTANKLQEEPLDFSAINIIPSGIEYKTIQAATLIFCDGARGAENPYFSLLPFALNKGEAVVIKAPELPSGYLYKKSMLLAPLAEKGLFWAGTNYIWEFDDDLPTKQFRTATEQTLKQWLRVPFTIIDHKAAVRPATVERRPFAGFHPVYKNIGVLNGMGTKGCSLAPYFANQLLRNILYREPLLKEVDIARFRQVLSRPLSGTAE